MSAVCFEAVTRRYGRVTALDAVDLLVPTGSLTVLCGPPRAGKSVLLRLLVGLERPESGRVLLDGQDVTALAPTERLIGYVPQSFALFPHMSVRDNIGYPLRSRGIARAEIDRRLAPVAEMLRITRLLEKRPSQLSGGEKQRAAIARGVLQEARVFALDDPLVGLDFKLRESLMDELRDMQQVLGATFLYATSDPLEALTMAERLAVLDRGTLIEAGTVDQVYHEPQRLRSAELTGFPRCNVLAGRIVDRRCETALGSVATDVAPGDVTIAVRPEHVVFTPGSGTAHDGLGGTGRVLLMENLGAECVVHAETGTGADAVTLVSTPAADTVAGLAVGDPFPFRIAGGCLALFDRSSGRRLGARRMAAYA